MITGLDDPSAVDPKRVGAKAAALALALQGGLPVLPGFVVEASASLRHLELGSSLLLGRGSGGARLAVISEPIPDAARITAAGRELSAALAVRSSSPLETDGQWAGAFTSYLGITPEELPKAVVGCWASAFSVDALNRQLQVGIEPGSVPVAVLVQPSIDPIVGGVAELSADGTLRVEAVAGSPAPLHQGWVRGVAATRRPAGGWEGGEAIALVGVEVLDQVGAALGAAQKGFGFDRCEWGVAGSLWLLQLGAGARPGLMRTSSQVSTTSDLIPLVQALMAAPGSLGAELVLPWAVAGIPALSPTRPVGDGDLLDQALELSESLTSQVWGLRAAQAIPAARSLLARLRGSNPEAEITTIHGLNPPEPDQASQLISTVRAMGELLVTRGILPGSGAVWHLSTAELRAALIGKPVTAPRRARISVWESLAAAVVLDHGVRHQGMAAAAGIGVGLRHHFDGADEQTPPLRAVVTAPLALPNLSQLIWDAAGLVTDRGSPAAHLFEAARSLGVPSVCSVDIGSEADQIVAVDGYAGVVATIPLTSQP